MSGLYNVVFGTNPNLPGVLGALIAAQEFDPGRLRDAWLEHGDEDDEVIARILTRNGGFNREDQADAIESMRSHPWFLYDADEKHDGTYASFYFKIDFGVINVIVDLEGGPAGEVEAAMRAAAVDPVDTDARWAEAMAKATGR